MQINIQKNVSCEKQDNFFNNYITIKTRYMVVIKGNIYFYFHTKPLWEKTLTLTVSCCEENEVTSKHAIWI